MRQPSVLTNMVTSIEQHVEWIAACLEHLRDGAATIEAEPQAVENWVAYVNTVAGLTLFPTCNSWYLGANIPASRVFMPLPGFPPYEAMCTNVAAQGYQGFVIDRAEVAECWGRCAPGRRTGGPRWSPGACPPSR